MKYKVWSPLHSLHGLLYLSLTECHYRPAEERETINENENEGPGALAVCWEPCVGGSLDFVAFFDEISEITLMD